MSENKREFPLRYCERDFRKLTNVLRCEEYNYLALGGIGISTLSLRSVLNLQR